ncbi:Aste57867_18513 [Aphanomyces stellatus]|uniref:Aste57867_18513 protein n=1 Tax=Aphanomyces stellatus TaxID=120398 RepID=A0A485LAW3_9STRA|nr:hypothetical protein As57867_018451 [Aphanomyces stellatus]VFT95249.1 Aste57867_18513 [Aphanomyces stellatus]
MIAPALHNNVHVATLRDGSPFSTTKRFLVTFGIGYLVLTLSLAISYLFALSPSMTNDLYWPGYNVTGYESLLIDLVNIKLSTAQNGSAGIIAPDASMLKSYVGPVVESEFASNYARKVLFTELNVLERAIRDLRNMTSGMATIYAQYCWVDFARRWDIAHTTGRSMRCQQRYQDNAAFYLETMFRNTDWDSFLATYNVQWTIAIGLAIQATPDGASWLAARSAYCKVLSVESEVALLRALNLTRFDLLWANEYHIGITETMEIVNALGVRQTIQLKEVIQGNDIWTSSILFWNFFNDISLMVYFNMSLVQGAENNAVTLGLDLGNMVFGFADSQGQYSQQLGVFYYGLGPFGSVDTFYLPLPRSFISLYQRFNSWLFEALWSNATLFSTFATIESILLTPLPPAFAGNGMIFYGGNLLCPFNPPTTFPQSQISFDDACTVVFPFTIAATPRSTGFALFSNSSTRITSICIMQKTPKCISTLTQTQTALATLGHPPADLLLMHSQAILDAPPAIFVQYAQNASNHWHLLQQSLVTSDLNWSFYGWLAFFDWVEGRREIFRLEGDAGTLIVVSEATPNVKLTQNNGNAAQSAPDTQIIYNLIAYVTTTNVFIGILIIMYTTFSGFCVDWRNFFVFNRVAGSIWIGRPLLLVRGLSAILVLSTSEVAMVTQNGYTKFENSPRSIWTTMVIAGESTWVSYVTIDALLLVTGGTTFVAAALATAISWITVVVLETHWPILMETTLNRRCTVVRTDKLLLCKSGTVNVGNVYRIAHLLLVHIVCVAISLAFAMCWSRLRRSRESSSVVLHGSAQAFLFNRTRHVGGATQLMDDAACVMVGLIPFSLHGKHVMFDIKLWILIQDENVTQRTGKSVSFRLPSKRIRTSTNGSTEYELMRSPGALWSRLLVAGGFFYILLSAVGSVSYISVSSVNFANDFYWATFNLTGHHVYVSDWMNEQIALGRSLEAAHLDDPKWSLMQYNFTTADSQMHVPSCLSSRLEVEVANSLTVAVKGLRLSDPCSIPWIFTQYCWLDFERRWQVANTDARQKRCLSTEITNGAVYVEAVLRNTDWSSWRCCWGRSFDIAFGNHLQLSLAGRNWLQMVGNVNTADGEEVAYWSKAGLLNYIVQWQNCKTVGLVNTYAIENAFGVQYAMTLSHTNGSYTFASQTSFKMYWTWASDLWAVSTNITLVGGFVGAPTLHLPINLFKLY